ncbi:MAG: hypothetical protein FWC01_02240 [Treponema sp.]|nr:hypothetical protein [Treponema sp.]MCL2237155.1 hypothetical protein [Treponema sp.]
MEDTGLGKPLIVSEKISIQKNAGNIVLCLPSHEGEPIEPEILYSGGENALFRRRPDQFILFEKVPEEFFNEDYVRETIFNKKEVLILEKSSGLKDEYSAKINLVFEILDSVETIVYDGYPLHTSLRARVTAEPDKPIRDIIESENLINLAAVLAREENYDLLKKYFDEGLPINDLISHSFKRWQPTPFHYVSTFRLVGYMQDPIKMLRYLAANGADPNIACKKGDTPLGNQCFNNGLSIVIKALLETGADPNHFTKIESGPIKPLHLMLLPFDYDEENREFTPIKESDIENISLLLEKGADVNYKTEEGITALYLALNNSVGTVRNKIVKLLLEKGADENAAMEALLKGTEKKHSHSAFVLFQIYSGHIEGLSTKPDAVLARKYLFLASDLMNG